MSSSNKNLSTYSSKNLDSLATKKFAIVVSEWNSEITESLYSGAFSTLTKHGIPRENIIKKYVPGSYELSLGAQWMAEKSDIDAV